MVFGFLKKLFGKKEEEFPPLEGEGGPVEEGEGAGVAGFPPPEEEKPSFEPFKPGPGPEPFKPRPEPFPEVRPTPAGPTGAEIQLILTKLDVISQRLEVIDRRLQYIEQVAKESSK